jgi:hypothetical protein
MIDLENLIDEIDLYEDRLKDMLERIKEMERETQEAWKEYIYTREYREYLLAKKRAPISRSSSETK